MLEGTKWKVCARGRESLSNSHHQRQSRTQSQSPSKCSASAKRLHMSPRSPPMLVSSSGPFILHCYMHRLRTGRSFVNPASTTRHFSNSHHLQHFEDGNSKSKVKSKNIYRITRQNKFYSIIGILSSLAVGAAVIYKEAKKLHKSTSVTHGHNVFELEQNVYIHVTSDVSEPSKSRKKKKRIWLPWLQARSRDPWRLLRLSQSEDARVRLLGVKALSELHDLKDSDLYMITQALDSRTLIGLARSPQSDSRFFRTQTKLLPDTGETLEESFRRLLSSLPTKDVDQCTRYFTSSALAKGKMPEEERGGVWCFGGNGLAFAESISPVPDEVVEAFCLQALNRHTRIDDHCGPIVRLGGLQMLQQIYELRKQSIKVRRNIARILSNLALSEELNHDIVQAGWVTVLSQWIKSPDLALSLLATKALANLDKDFGYGRKYADGVYLYHPQYRYSEPVYVDIVFVHGLLGGPFRTWRQKDVGKPESTPNSSNRKSNDISSKPGEGTSVQKVGKDLTINDKKRVLPKLPTGSAGVVHAGSRRNEKPQSPTKLEPEPYTFCWPKDWLAKDCPHVRIITVEYETQLSEWAPKCPYESKKRLLARRSQEMLKKLRTAGIGDRPIIWVGHSMGGLLIKKMLVDAEKDPSLTGIVDQTRGIIFYSVPHQGSALAAYTNQTKYLLYPSVEVKELAQGSEMLQKLHSEFQQLMFEDGIPLLSFGEGRKTDLPLNVKVLMVPPESSDPGFGEYHYMEDMNHLEICKPDSRDSDLYRLTLEFIQSCIDLNLVDHILLANMPDDMLPKVLVSS